MAVVVLFLEGLALGGELAGLRPVPGHLGRHPAAGECRDVAALAGEGVGVRVEALGSQQVLLVRLVAVAGLAGGRIAGGLFAAQQGAMWVGRGYRDAAAGDGVLVADMAVAAAEVEPVLVHVHIERVGGGIERGVEVTVLDAVAAAAVVVAGAAGVTTGAADGLGDLGQVDGLDELARARRIFAAHRHRIAGKAGRFGVAAGVVTGQAIDLVAVAEVEVLVFPAVADVAGLAEGLVGLVADAEGVDHGLLAQVLAGVRIDVIPGPVPGLHDLMRGLGVAFEAGAGDRLAAIEGASQFFEFAVIGRGRRARGARCDAGAGEQQGHGEKDMYRSVPHVVCLLE